MKAFRLFATTLFLLTTFAASVTAQTCQAPSSSQLYATNITFNSARLNCSTIYGASIYQFQHRRYGTSAWTLGVSSSQNFSYVTGLLPTTTYEFQCRVYCGNGWTNYSASQYFATTAGGNSCNNPIELACGSNINGSNNTGNYNYTTYPFQYGSGMTGPEAYHRLSIAYPVLVTINMTGLTQDLDLYLHSTCSNSNGLAYSYNPGNASEQITINLTPGTYYIIVDGYAGAISNYSLSVSCVQSNECPAPTYDESYASNLTCSSARLNCSAGGYTWGWTYRQLNTVAWIDLPTTSVPYFDLSNLQASTTYEYRSAKRCSNNTWSAWSPIRQFSTPNCNINSCNNPITAYCGYTYTGNNNAGGYNFSGYYYNGFYYSETGREMIYRINLPSSGPLTLSLGGLTGDLDLFLLSSCSNNAVVKASLNSGSNSETIMINNLPAGTYLIVIDGYQNTTSNYSLGVTCNVPNNNSNDEPCYAAPLTPYTSCYQTYATNVGATTTTNPLPPPECNTYYMRDVWFKVPIPASGLIFVQTFPGTLTNGLLGIYAGTYCTGLTNYGCFDNNSNGDLMPDLTISATPGSYVYLRIWGYNGTTGTFSICVTTLANLSNGEADVTIDDAPNGVDERTANIEKGEKIVDAISATMRLYPVPTRDVLNLEASLPEEAEVRVQIYNLAGQVVLEESPTKHSSGYLLQTLDISTLPPGIYMLKLQTGAVEAISRFIKT